MPPISKTVAKLVLDLLSVHLIRHVDGSAIVSFHPEIDYPTTAAAYVHGRIRFAGGCRIYTNYMNWTRTE